MPDLTDLFQVKQYRIATEFFTRGYPLGGSPCSCTSKCCSGGVYADVLERDRIMASREMIKKYMDETQPVDDTTWFDPEEIEDDDFPSGKAIGTSVYHGKCVFLNKRGHCSLQIAAGTEGMDRWAIKPLFCILFPVEISGNVIGFDDMLQGEEGCCTISEKFEVPLYEACKDELVHLVGEDGFAALRQHYRERYAVHASAKVE